MRKDSSGVFRARSSDEARSLLLVFWAMQQDVADTLCSRNVGEYSVHVLRLARRLGRLLPFGEA
jgi:hypothetical protein